MPVHSHSPLILVQIVRSTTFLLVCLCSLAAEAAPVSSLTLTSSSPYLESAFNWNKAKALSWVRTGVKSGYIPCYWAGYNYRQAFYVRDIAHQCEGAALLGLNDENFAMWQAFAGTANESRQWFCLWALDFYGKTYAVDYRSDTNFVREIPAPLELVDKAYACYKWSADPRWIGDPVLTNFYRTTMNQFIAKHDDDGDGIAEGHAIDIFDGACGSYCEQSAGGYGVGGDNIATTWSAYIAYANLLTAMGRRAEAALCLAKADRVKRAYDQNWWNAGAGNYYAGRTIGLTGWITNFDQFSKETYTFQAVKGIAQPGDRAEALLEKIDRNYRENRRHYNFESFTYLPEVFYNYGMNDKGWYWLKCIMDSHYEYPEVSFTSVEFIATGMMGIEPDAPNHKIATLGRLTDEVGWVQLDHIPVGACDVLVKHENSNRTTTVRNHTGDTTLTWEARFPGSFGMLVVDGVPQTATHNTLNGVNVSSVEVRLRGGEQKTVKVEAQ
jgi:hypothetical protein